MGMKPELVLDEEGISQRFKYAKARTARGGSESGELEASSSSAEVTPSPLTSPIASENNELVSDLRQRGSHNGEKVRRHMPDLGSGYFGLQSVSQSHSPSTSSGLTGRGWPYPLTGHQINKVEVSPGRLWPIQQSPWRPFHSDMNVSPGTDLHSRQSQSKTYLRSSVSPVETDWYPPPPETIIKEERDPVQPQPIRVSVIQSNPNTYTPIKIETPPPPPGLESRVREPCGREQGNFVLPAPLPLIKLPFHPYYPQYNFSHQSATIQENRHNTLSQGVRHQVPCDISSRQTWENILGMTRTRMMEDTRMKNKESLINNDIEESTNKDITQGIITKREEAIPDKIIERYLHKKFRKIFNDNDEEDNIDEVINQVSTVHTNNDPIDIDWEIDSPTSISSLLFQACPIDTRELDLMFVDDLEKVFFQSWRQLNIGEFSVNTYLDFCINKRDIDPMFFYVVNLQFR